MKNSKTKNPLRCALGKVPSGKLREVKDRLKRELGIKTDTGLMSLSYGNRGVYIQKAFIIVSIFREYGIDAICACDEFEKENPQ